MQQLSNYIASCSMKVHGIAHAQATMQNKWLVPGRRDFSQLGIQELPPVLLASCCRVLSVTEHIAKFGCVRARIDKSVHQSRTWNSRTEAVLCLR